jgi:hypothetical protein
MKGSIDRQIGEGGGIIRKVDVGGLSRSELREELRRNRVLLNAYAEQLFASDRFTTAKRRYSVTTVEVSGRNLGFQRGATAFEINKRAASHGLALGPLELAPHLRLQYRDQEEGDREERQEHGRAPFGSLTVASSPHSADADGLRGFYLRRIKGDLWLRGYCASPDHEWNPDDRFVFIVPDRLNMKGGTRRER